MIGGMRHESVYINEMSMVAKASRNLEIYGNNFLNANTSFLGIPFKRIFARGISLISRALKVRTLAKNNLRFTLFW